MSRRRKAKRPTSSYLSAAKSNRDLVPSLKKYSRRKNLTRWEKSAITRAGNKIRHAGGRSQLFSLTKIQARRLKDKDPLIGGGVRAIALRNTAPDSKVHVRKGKISVQTNGREIKYISAKADIGAILNEIEKAFKKPGINTVWLWTVKGRAQRGFRSMERALEELRAAFEAYTNTDEWLLGIAHLGTAA